MSTIEEDKPKNLGRRRLLWGSAVFTGLVAVPAFLGGCARYYGSHRHRRYADLSSEELTERIHERIEWALDRVDASAEQKARIKTIVGDVTPQLSNLREKRKQIVSKFTEALKANQVSAKELQEIRGESLSLADQALGQGMDVVVRVTEVLTPEQRRKLIEHWSKRRA